MREWIFFTLASITHCLNNSINTFAKICAGFLLNCFTGFSC